MSSVTVQGVGTPLPACERAATSRDRILDVALDVLTRAGRRHDDIQEIAKRAQVGKATVYREFGSRNGLLVELAKRGIEQLLERILAALAADFDPDRAFGAVVRAALTFFDERPKLARLLLLEAGESREPIIAHYLRRYEESRPAAVLLLDRHPRPAALAGQPAALLVDALTHLVTGRLFYWVLTGQRDQLADDADMLTAVFLGGVTSCARRET